jgi:hypothetical protein
MSGSRLIAYIVTTLDVIATLFTLYLYWLSVLRGYTGGLPYLTTLIGALQAATAIILNAYYKKSGLENSKGGIVYETVVNSCEKDL